MYHFKTKQSRYRRYSCRIVCCFNIISHTDTSFSSKSDTKVSIESIQDIMLFPDIKYVGQVVYEVKHLNSEWLMRFIVTKHLNALLEVSDTVTVI